jgi:hypothetical protein
VKSRCCVTSQFVPVVYDLIMRFGHLPHKYVESFFTIKKVSRQYTELTNCSHWHIELRDFFQLMRGCAFKTKSSFEFLVLKDRQ